MIKLGAGRVAGESILAEVADVHREGPAEGKAQPCRVPHGLETNRSSTRRENEVGCGGPSDDVTSCLPLEHRIVRETSRRGQPGAQMKLDEGPAMKILTNLIGHKKGATAIEYGLIAALVAVAAVGAMSNLGSQLKKTFNNTSTTMSKG